MIKISDLTIILLPKPCKTFRKCALPVPRDNRILIFSLGPFLEFTWRPFQGIESNI